ncbi:TetR/AcrR family transcriptional regulator [Nocardioides salsibiostraticola]
MSSLRNNPSDQSGLDAADQPGTQPGAASTDQAGGTAASKEGPREARDGYLDAARHCILDVGWRRTTLTEVARRAGVSRMTIYRTWPDMPQLLSDLMAREWSGVVEAVVREQDQRSGVDRLVAQVTATVHELRENELFVRIVELDPELILPYLFYRRGRSQNLVLNLTEAAVRAGQDAGEIRPGNPTTLARTLMLTGYGFVFSAQTVLDDDCTEEQLDAELTELLTRALQP